MYIYVASSWRCERQPAVVQALRDVGHTVYDFRNPAPGDHGFRWDEIDKNWKNWTADQFRKGLEAPIAVDGFCKDMGGLEAADVCVLCLPCGRSAHLEAGWAKGAGTTLIVLLDNKPDPELIYIMADYICASLEECVARVRQIHADDIERRAKR